MTSLGEIPDYYRIDGRLHNCYVYAYYLRKALRNRPPVRPPPRRRLRS